MRRSARPRPCRLRAALAAGLVLLAVPQAAPAHHRDGHDGGPPWARATHPVPAPPRPEPARPPQGDLGPDLEQHLLDMERPDRDRVQHVPIAPATRPAPPITRQRPAVRRRTSTPRRRAAVRRRAVRRARVPNVPYGALIATSARRHGVPVSLFTALVARESGFRANARSHAGARGLTQLMPATARLLGVRRVDDPRQNLDGGARYLKAMLRAFGSTRLALAAYNAGPGAVRRFGGVPPYAETRGYVTAILALQRRLRRAGIR